MYGPDFSVVEMMNRRLIVCVIWCEEILILGTRQASWQAFNRKRNWKLFHFILDHSGFSINHETGCILAGDDAWDRLIAQNKDVKLFRNRPLLYREGLDGIFSGTVATEEFSQLLAESMFDDLGLDSQVTSQVEEGET
jgi:hypothetical protein